MQIVLCDDESVYLHTVEQQILSWGKKNNRNDSLTIKLFQSSEDLLEAWTNGMDIDILFVDIQIPGELSGMELAREIHEKDEYVPIVFITNYAEYAYEGYCVNALRYLRKPMLQKDIDVCMDIAWRQWINHQSTFVSLVTASQSIHVPIHAIIYAEIIAHKLRIVAADEIGEYEIRSTLDRLEEKLPADEFVRCHKSFLVSLRYIRKYKSGAVTISSGLEIPVGRKYIRSFADKFRLYYQGDVK